MLGLYKFYEDCYYGSLSGLFLEDVDKVNNIIIENKTICFIECLGKFSEDLIQLNNENLKLLSTDKNLISEIIKNLGEDFLVGYNPIHILEDQDQDNE